MKRLYSISFVWPSGKTWSGVGGNRLSPQWYYACLLDFIKRNSAKEDVRFVVHMHETIRSTLPTGPIHESCVPPSTLSIEYCNADLPPMWPNVKRFEPLIDCISNELVIVADIHDVPDLQTKTIEHYTSFITNSQKEWEITHLLATLNDEHSEDSSSEDVTVTHPSHPNGMVLTFWPTSDDTYLAESFHDNRVAPKPTLEAVHPKLTNKWIVDGGLALSNLNARLMIRESHKGVSFAQHIRECSRIYNWDEEERRGTDEALLQLYLLSFQAMDVPIESYEQKQSMEHVIRRAAHPFVHNLNRRDSNPPLREVFLPINYLPHYTYRFSHQRKNFAYDGEGEFKHRGRYIALQWKPQQVQGVRSSKRKGVKPWRPEVAHGSSDEVSVQPYKR